MVSSKVPTKESIFYCTNCGNRNYGLPRKANRLKKGGHLKKVYCVHCREVYNNYECRTVLDIEEFKEKFENGEFAEVNKFLEDERAHRKELNIL